LPELKMIECLRGRGRKGGRRTTAKREEKAGQIGQRAIKETKSELWNRGE